MVHEQPLSSGVGLRRPQFGVPGVPGGWMSADSCPPVGLRGPCVLAWAGLWDPSVLVAPGWLWGSKWLRVCRLRPQVLLAPRLLVAGLPARPGRKQASEVPGPVVDGLGRGRSGQDWIGCTVKMIPLPMPWPTSSTSGSSRPCISHCASWTFGCKW